MNRFQFVSIGILLSCFTLQLRAAEDENLPCYLFTYFTGNGESGLHLAYSHDGLKWTPLQDGKPFLQPKVGKEPLLRDPCIIQGTDGVFHMVWTTNWNERGIGIAHSRDLVHWSEQRFLPVMRHEPDARNCWAPELFYNDINDEYLIFWATTIPGRFPETDDQGDSRYNHRMYSVTTQDFQQYSETRLWYDPGFNVIDSTVFKRGENQYVMILKNETRTPPEKNPRVATADNPRGPWSDASEPITGDYWAEGPTVLQLGEYVYVYFDKYRQHRYGAVRTKDLKQWEDVSDQVDFSDGFRHGTALPVDCSILNHLKALGKSQ